MTFYRNGKSCGKAFDNIPADTFHPIVSLLNSMGDEVRVTLNTSVREPGQSESKRPRHEPSEAHKIPGLNSGSFFEKLVQQQKES